MSAPKVEVFTDGSCRGNPGPGGWAAILRSGAHEKEISGGERATTNNRMELTAAIRALEALKSPSAVTIHTDSGIRDGRADQVAAQMETQRLEDGRQEAGEERRSVARARRGLPCANTRYGAGRGHDGHVENERAGTRSRKRRFRTRNQISDIRNQAAERRLF